jgi:radical SAM-linked protein
MPLYRISYEKTGSARFISHLDMISTFERSLRRAGLPVALSQGFNPHFKLFFGFPLPVGFIGLAEFFDLELVEDISSDALASGFNSALPSGFRIIGACLLKEGLPALMAQVQESTYQLAFDDTGIEASFETINGYLEDIISKEKIEISRRKKDGKIISFDLRPGIKNLSLAKNNGRIIIQMDLMTSSSLNIRPMEVIKYLEIYPGMFGVSGLIEVTRCKMLAEGGQELLSFCAIPVGSTNYKE